MNKAEQLGFLRGGIGGEKKRERLEFLRGEIGVTRRRVERLG